MDCQAFTLNFTGSAEELLNNAKQAASEQGFNLIVEPNEVSVKMFGFTMAKFSYAVNGQQVTISIIQNPPGWACEKTQHVISKFMGSGKTA
jgi:hypothetical protein